MSSSVDVGNSPMFPVDKDLQIADSAQPLTQTTSIQIFIQLAEPVLFLQGFEQHQWEERPPGLLRGTLIIRVLKPSKIKSIDLTFKGTSRTEWPEGIPPRRQEFLETIDIVNHTWPFFQLEHNNVHSSGSTDADDLLKGSCASLYRPLKNKRGSVSYINLNAATPASPPKNQGTNFLPIGNILRKATSPDSQKRERSRSISDLLAGTLSNNSDNASLFSKSSSSGGEPFIFQPGDYIYGFEQTIPLSCPESVQAAFGSVEYTLSANVERSGAFKSNLHARLPLEVIRTPSDSSVEETEPIAISRDWEDQLHYDIVIASKDIVLDAFLPIAFKITPMDKVNLHRIRIYLTETMEYYCKNKKVHRLEPAKKFLLAEHKAPVLENLPSNANASKAKNLGNLLIDESNGDLVSKEFGYQVFIPERLNLQQRIHPDTSYQNIKANHWIKICLRLSRNLDGKKKHYEVSIDSPIHVLNKLCSHANTLLPSYDTHTFIPGTDCSEFGDLNVNLYHVSNLYFPKEVIGSPALSPEVMPLEERGTFSPRSLSPIRNGGSSISLHSRRADGQPKMLDDFILRSPELKSNVYQPDNIKPELTSPQAIPLSPISSPRARPINMIRTPSFEPPPFDANEPPSRTLFKAMTDPMSRAPRDPPTYQEVMAADGVAPVLRPPKFKITSSNEYDDDGVDPKNTQKKDLEEESGDIASSFSFNGTRLDSPDLPSSILKSSPKLRPLNFAHGPSRRGSIQDNLPSTVKNSSENYSDLNDILNSPDISTDRNIVPSRSSSAAASPRSSIETAASFITQREDTMNMEPLLSPKANQTLDTLLQSKESLNDYADDATEASVDITALYDRNSNSWHPLQNNVPTHPIISRQYSSGVADGNNVFEDFKKAFKIPAGTEYTRASTKQELTTSSATAGSESSPENITFSDSPQTNQ